MPDLYALEICAGAGGQALGLEQARFKHRAAVEIEPEACATLRPNRPKWNVVEGDVHDFDGHPYRGRVDLLAGGVPCPPFSIAGKQLGADDERDLFPQALRLVEEIQPQAVMLENVRGLGSARFEGYREQIKDRLRELGYEPDWRLLNASGFGVSQLRPRFILVALRPEAAPFFDWPVETASAVTVGELLKDLMAERGWPGAEEWVGKARGIAPTLVGGSRKHGGPDLGPTRARAAWLQLGVDGRGVANETPGPDYPVNHVPRLTLPMVARVQGFPDSWRFSGRKTAAYRQVGNAFPPPVARAVGVEIRKALRAAANSTQLRQAG